MWGNYNSSLLIAPHCSLHLIAHCSFLAATALAWQLLSIYFLQHSSSLRGNLKNFNPFFLPNQLVHLTTQQFLGIFTIKTAVNLPPSRCNLTAPYREYNLHLINIPALAYREKVYTRAMSERPFMGELFTGLSIGCLTGQLLPIGYFSLSQIVAIPTSIALAMMPVLVRLSLE